MHRNDTEPMIKYRTRSHSNINDTLTLQYFQDVCLGAHVLTQFLHEYKIGLFLFRCDVLFLKSGSFFQKAHSSGKPPITAFLGTKAAQSTTTVLKGDHGCLCKYCLHCLSFKLSQRVWRRYARIQKSVKPQKCILSISKNRKWVNYLKMHPKQ